MQRLVLVIILGSYIIFSTGYQNYREDSNRTGKFLFIFPFYRLLPGLPCQGTSNLNGICLTQRQCNARNGVCSGSCSSGRGVCCVYQKTCGDSSNANITYFTSPSYPSGYTAGSSCKITINKITADICQLRIDFLEMTLSEPTGSGVCNNDNLNLGNPNLPKLCGENSGQHVYVNFAGSSYSLTVDTLSSVSTSRRWNFEITQISCNDSNKAPTGCLKYYTGPQGTDTSFNYSPVLSTTGGLGNRVLTGLNYGVCVRQEAGFCSIEWSQTSGNYSFTISGNTSSEIGTSVVGENCTTNYVVIPSPSTTNQLTYDRFCGNSFPTVTTSSKPFVLTVVTSNVQSNANSENRGFILSYSQKQCARTR